MMLRLALPLVLAVTAAPAVSQTENALSPEEKAISCGHQAEVVAAVRQARLDRVRERKVPETLKGAAQVWPEKFNAIIPIVTPWIYELPRNEVQDNDLAQIWKEGCLAQ
jgi:hypothetical protein